MKIKKIIWFVNKFEAPGGGERWILEGEKIFRRKGIETFVVTPNFNKKVFFDGKYNIENIVVLEKKFNNKYLNYISYFFQFVSFAKKNKIDFILAQEYGGYVLTFFVSLWTKIPYALFDFGQLFQIPNNNIKYSLSFRKKAKTIVNEIYKDIAENVWDENFKIELRKRLLLEIKGLLLKLSFKYSSCIFTLSNRVKRENEILFSKLAYPIKSAFDKEILTLRENRKNVSEIRDKKRIISIGRLVPHKRTELVVYSVDKVREDNVKNFELVIGSTGPEKEKLENIVRKKKLQDLVKFAGYIKEEDLTDFYLSGDIFITMDSADFDITVYMAMALGLRVIVPEIMEIDEEFIRTGSVIKVGPTIADISDKLKKALEMPPITYNEEEKKLLSSYTWEAGFEKVTDVLNKNKRED